MKGEAYSNRGTTDLQGSFLFFLYNCPHIDEKARGFIEKTTALRTLARKRSFLGRQELDA